MDRDNDAFAVYLRAAALGDWEMKDLISRIPVRTRNFWMSGGNYDQNIKRKIEVLETYFNKGDDEPPTDEEE